LPICPAPITPTFLITAAIMSSTGTARYQPRLPIPLSREVRFNQNPASKPRLDRFEGASHAKENASKSNTGRSLWLRPVF
jgi:hypothetical protein